MELPLEMELSCPPRRVAAGAVAAEVGVARPCCVAAATREEDGLLLPARLSWRSARDMRLAFCFLLFLLLLPSLVVVVVVVFTALVAFEFLGWGV